MTPLCLGLGNFVLKNTKFVEFWWSPRPFFVKLSIGVAWFGAPTPYMALRVLFRPSAIRYATPRIFFVLFSGEVVPLLLSGGAAKHVTG